MTWFKVDDGFAFHPKALAAGNSALGLWVRAGAWCAANLTEGALPRHMIGTLGAQKRDARRLVSAGLWCETEDGYQFNSWDHYQPTKTQVEAQRKANRERQARAREREANAVSNAVTNGGSNGGSNATPVPTRPKKTSSSSKEDPAFEAFWDVYPKRVGKPAARKSWGTAVKETAPDLIVEAAGRYSARMSSTGTDQKFICNPSTWLHQERFNDEPQQTNEQSKTYWTPPAPPREIADNPELYSEWYAEQMAQRGAS